MENIQNDNETTNWKGILATILIASIIVGCLIYIFYQHDRLTDTLEALQTVTEEKETVEARLAEVEVDLETANEKNERQAKTIRELTDALVTMSTELEEHKILVASEDARWQRRYEEYGTATEVWTYMKVLGWNDIVCAGIMGNLMAETGGSGTLNLDWDSNTSSGYGLVQWIGQRRADIKNKYGEYPSVEEQVQFIHDELYGADGVTCQVTDYQLNTIMNAETPEDCAFAFACYYERCNEEYRDIRRDYARWAYNYFCT